MFIFLYHIMSINLVHMYSVVDYVCARCELVVFFRNSSFLSLCDGPAVCLPVSSLMTLACTVRISCVQLTSLL